MLLWGYSELAVEGVVPHFLHVVPIFNDTMLNGVLDAEDSTFLLGLFANVDFLLIEADHDAGHLGSADHC